MGDIGVGRMPAFTPTTGAAKKNEPSAGALPGKQK